MDAITAQKTSLKQVGLCGFFSRLHWYMRERRRHIQVAPQNRKLQNNYLSSAKVAKLHLGCGRHLLDGWLNTDLNQSEGVMALDATKEFPFVDSSFDYVYSEHMIEHIQYPDGQRMLSECFRMLRPGGRIRIATPDLQFLIALYNPNKSDLQRSYIRWATEIFVKHAPFQADTFVINNFFRDWGHQIIYDEKTLRFALERCGFVDITRCPLCESTDAELRGLENHGRMPPEFLELETIVMEGRKPSSGVGV